jgi:hypothetical protein
LIYSIEIRSKKSWTKEKWGPIENTLKLFLDAEELGFFGAKKPLRSRAIDHLYDSDLKIIAIRNTFEAEPISPAAFIVLVGMLKVRPDLREVKDFTVEINSVTIFQDGVQLSIDKSALGQLKAKTRKGVHFTTPEFFRLIDPFVLFIVFDRPIGDEDKEFLRYGVEVWENLIIGGLPDDDIDLGESAVGATTGFFCEPKIFHYAIEGIFANMICFDLLISFFRNHTDRLPVQTIEIQ